ncbi:NusG domain II-containing protein [Candidatus Caldatribacterium sp. SIUC1]|uniref:NusG domain II-containing protein n=1 Tax=Candidatus Caldatribacterium sp. SIUC1 TaxID=3418365 RepID=UPI003F692343
MVVYLFRRSDWLSLIAVGVVLGILFLFRYVPFEGKGQERYTVVIESEKGRMEVPVTPQDDREIVVSGPLGKTIVAVRGGKVFVVTSPCPDKVCIKTGKIPDDTSFIACIPNRVVIRLAR